MKRVNRLWLGLGISVAAIGAVAGATLGVTTLFDVTLEEGEPKSAEGFQRENLGTGDAKPGHDAQVARSLGLSFCIQAIGVDPALEAVAKARVETALLQVMQHQHWKLLKKDSVPPIVDVGCPSEPLVSKPGLRWIEAQYVGGNLNQHNVAEPSFYHTFIFLMPVDRINQLLGGLSVRLAPQEYVWISHDEVHLTTTAIFVSPEEMEDSSFLVKQLTIGVGLESPFPAATSQP